tara:strand:- start:349 stop:558 length:210 start_codon:yes stop_codon:yes gene_type:complete
MDGVGFVKTFGKQIRSVCDVAKPACRQAGPWVFKAVETLFFFKTCAVLTSSIRVLGILWNTFALERTGS